MVAYVVYYADLHDTIYNAPTTISFATLDEAVTYAHDHPQGIIRVLNGTTPVAGPYNTAQYYLDQDDVVLPGDLTVLGTINGSVGSSAAAHQFRVSTYGAVGDGVTDDSAAIRAAIDAAAAFAVNTTQLPNGQGHYYAEVLFDSTTYLCNTLAQRSVTNGGQNALLCMPHNPIADQKLTINLRGAGGGGFLMFGQTVPYRTGTVIRTTLTGLSTQSVNGVSVPPSIVGFPRYNSSSLWSNTLFMADGLTVTAPRDPGIVGFDLLRASQMRCGALTVIGDAPQTGAGNITTTPTNGLGVGMFAPDNLNNDHNTIERYSCEGFQTGLVPSEHFHADTVALIYCQDGIFFSGAGTFLHGWGIDQLSVEASGRHAISIGNTGGLSVPVFIGAMHTETLGSADVDDPGSRLHGTIRWHAISRTAPTVNGATNVQIINERVPRGAVTGTVAGINLPAVPASTTPLTNPYFRDAAVTVAGGTVTAIAVDGQTLGITSGTITVPSGKPFTLTYSVAPTLAWTLL